MLRRAWAWAGPVLVVTGMALAAAGWGGVFGTSCTGRYMEADDPCFQTTPLGTYILAAMAAIPLTVVGLLLTGFLGELRRMALSALLGGALGAAVALAAGWWPVAAVVGGAGAVLAAAVWGTERLARRLRALVEADPAPPAGPAPKRTR
ncbi:hypothetical protein [Allonocardiopsis opalescens]|uniref:Uncharacterized protein n=1 Tax=Allonocardiopsis opalescens TaxID=1144618 RepID=A0A2T0QEW2_9ACTN|nr:hypothetical protein [Allonocardiopsis opalescens]PRY02458.1 hypothetical protein CLV72_1011060 [Allonocardiopsis opalescens]